MANPLVVIIPKDTWTKVATSVVTGQIWIKKTSIQYLHTYRETGESAPTDKSEGIGAFINGDVVEQISSSILIDVYLYAINIDGEVRVDL